MLLVILLVLLLLIIIQNIVLIRIVSYHWRNRNFGITKKDSNSKVILLHLYYLKINNPVNLVVNNISRNFTMPSSFNGKKLFYG